MNKSIFATAAVFLFAATLGAAAAQFLGQGDANPNDYPDPYGGRTSFLKLPPGRVMGSSSAVYGDSQGHIWVMDRCGADSCQDSKLDPILEFGADGNFIKSFGGGMMVFPHGLFIDKSDHIWVTDAGVGGGKGDDVMAFDQNGKLLRTLGKPGIAGDDPGLFSEPNAVLVAPSGNIFVADGLQAGTGTARITKFDANGKFVKEWGGHGPGQGEFDIPDSLAMDSAGRLYVADSWNNRIQIFDQDGNLEDVWTQFGRPSAIYIDKKDNLYVADSQSRGPVLPGYHPGWRRGIRIGSVKDGTVRAFIPDTFDQPDHVPTSGAEGVWADANGVIYAAEVREKAVVKYMPR